MNPQPKFPLSLAKRVLLLFILGAASMFLIKAIYAWKPLKPQPSNRPLGAPTQTGQRKRIIEETPYPDSPVKIVSITNSRHPIKSKEAFLDDDDWLRGLEVEVVNKSGKPITYVGIYLLLERPPEQAGQPPGFWELRYGIDPFSISAEAAAPASKSKSKSKIKPIQPEETALIELSGLGYEDLKAFLQEIGYPVAVEKIRLWVTTVGFDDGTAWGGAYYIRDPSAPHGWRLRDPPQGSTKKSAAFLFQNRLIITALTGRAS